MEAGLRDQIITARLLAELASIADGRLVKDSLESAEAPARLVRHLGPALSRAFMALPEAERPARAAELANALLSLISEQDEEIALPPEVLLGIEADASPGLADPPPLPPRPEIPLSASDLLFNGAGQPTIGSELRAELQSVESVDLICAFVIWSGVRVLKDQLAGVIERGGVVRVVTTTYMNATEPRALQALADLGAEIKVAYDARTTKLHAKSWLLERPHGLTTAFIGSSNVSYTALHEGLEWNVRLSGSDTPHLIERVRATFQAHWENPHFESFDPDRDLDRLQRALDEDSRRRTGDRSISFAGLDVHPYPHQRRMLEQLEVERSLHDRHANLVVAATGTGKTVIAALDYRDLCAQMGGQPSLLFVAHRRRILEQSMDTFRAVLRSGNFGEMLGDGETPSRGEHVFAMVQSLTTETVDTLEPDAFDIVIVDEFHHAAAPTYRAVLDRLEPQELLGLTATPERLDGADITEWFDGRIAVELRLWEAIDQGFLCPFQYFGVADGTDLRQLQWSRGSYAVGALSDLYTADDHRVSKLLEALQRIVAEPQAMKALGFCVTVEHAEFMADRFMKAGLPAVALSGNNSAEERDRALSDLRDGQICAVFSVDVLGEGVDVPSVDTVLLLRPTQSPTVFTQQLGRGLRVAEGKPCLTVIDLIGQQRREFRFDRRLQAITDRGQGPVAGQVEDGFPVLPSGCEIQMDRVAQEIVLQSLRETARLGRWAALRDDLAGLPAVSLGEFLEHTDRKPTDLYKTGRSWAQLRVDAGIDDEPIDEDERKLLRSLSRMLHVDDRERVMRYAEILRSGYPPTVDSADPHNRRLYSMLHFGLWGVSTKFDSFDEGFERLWEFGRVRGELAELVAILGAQSNVLTRPLGLDPANPLAVHGSYSRDEVLAAFGVGTASNPPSLREGVKWVEEEKTDLLFVTLEKAERSYSPSTMYRDYAISPDLFHWESQSVLREGAPTAQRYINHAERGSNVVFFVRRRSKTETGTTSPYVCLGPATYVEHRGERPLAITWKLRDAMPEELFEAAQAVAAA